MTPRSHRLTSLIVLFTLSASLAVALLTPAADEPNLPPGVVATLKGHAETVYAVAFSPDGKQVATGSFDKTIKLWDPATGKELKTLAGQNGHQNLILTLAFSPDGQTLASGASDNQVKVWDVPSASPLRELAGPDGLTGLSVTQDGKTMAVGCNDSGVRLVNTTTGKQLIALSGHAGPVASVSISQNAQFVASGGADRSVRVWNAANGQPAGVLYPDAGPLTSVLVHPNNGQLLCTGEDGTLKAFQLPLPAPRPFPPQDGPVTGVALSNDGNVVVTGNADKTVRLSNAGNGQPMAQLKGPAAGVASVAVAPNGSTVAAGTADRHLFLWTPNDGKIQAQVIAHAGAVTTVGYNPGGNQLLTGGADGVVKIWGLPVVPPRSVVHPAAVTASAFTQNGQRLLTGSADKLVRLWNATNAQLERQFAGHAGPVTAVALTNDAGVIASGSADETIRLWNRDNGQVREVLGAHAGALTTLGLHPNNQQLISAGEDGTVKLWQIPQAPAKPLVHPDQVTCAAVSPDGGRLLTGCADKQVRQWTTGDGQLARTYQGLGLVVSAVAVSPNNQFVAGAGADKAVIVWNAADGQVIKKVEVPAVAQSLALSPDGKTVLAGLADASVQLIDVGTGKSVKTFAGHAGPVNGLAFTPKGDQFVSASTDKTARLWNLAEAAAKQTFAHPGPVLSLALTRDGAKVFTGGADKTVKAWTLADGKPAGEVVTPAEVRSLAVSADGTRLLAGGGDNRARVYSPDGSLREFFAHEGPITGVGFGADPRLVVSTSADKTARLTMSSCLWVGRHAGPVRRAVISPRGDLAISAGDDKTVKLWALADGKEVRSIPAHDMPISGLIISADGLQLVTAAADKTLKVWDTAGPAAGPDKPRVTVSLPGPATALGVSPSSARVAVAVGAEPNGSVLVFDPATGKELVQQPVPAGIHDLAFAGDNRTLLVGRTDKNADVIDVNVQAAIDAHAGGVSSAQFHGNGGQLLTGGADKTMKLWNLADGKLAKTFGPLPDAVAAVCFSRDSQLAAAAAGPAVKLWNLADGKDLPGLTHPAAVTSLSFSPDRTKLVTGCADNLARVWDVATGDKLQAFVHAGPVTGVVFHNDSRSVVSVSAAKTVAFDTLAIQQVIRAANGPVRALAVSPAGQPVTAGDDKTVKFWNLGNKTAERTLPAVDGVVTALASARNNVLFAAGGADKVVRVYSLADGRQVGLMKASGVVRGLSFSPNSQMLAAANEDGAVETWYVGYNQGQPPPPDFGRVLQSYQHGAAATGVSYLDDASLVSCSLDKTARFWKVAADAPLKNFGLPNLVDSVSFDPPGKVLATGCHDGVIRLFDVAKNQQIREIRAHAMPMPSPVYAVAWSPDGKQLVSCSLDRSLKIWDAASGNQIREIKPYKEKEFEQGHRDGVFTAVYSPDGKFIASGGSDRTIKLWNAADGTLVRDLVNPSLKPPGVPPGAPTPPPQSHPGWVYSLKFSGDGKLLVSAGNAPRNHGYLAVWNPSDGKLLGAEQLPLGQFYSVAVAPDGKTVAVACGPRGRGPVPEVSSFVLKVPTTVKE